MRLLLVVCLLSSLAILNSISFENSMLQIIEDGELSRIEVKDDLTIYDYSTNYTPAIPLKTIHFLIPNGKKLSDVSVKVTDYEIIELDIPLMCAPEPVINSTKSIDVINTPFLGNTNNILVNYFTNQAGANRFGSVTVTSALYDYIAKRLKVPQTFEVEYTLESSSFSPNPQTFSSNLIARELKLSDSRNDEPGTILYIGTQAILNEMSDLFDFRNSQGFQVRFESLANILAMSSGVDDAAKLKEFIRTEYLVYNIDQVTLLGDYDVIPYRWVWAFDCEFGMSDIENEIPSDMYFACLDNSWDSNGNGIYGEDADNPDWYPELFVSRISFDDASEVQGYIDRLISYEKGLEYPERGYNYSIGLSTNLWDDSNSVIAQEYIVNHYYPPYYNSTIYNEEENTINNFSNEIMQKPNIIQHTGHAFHYVMSLFDEYLTVGFAEALNLQATTGSMYSIGCWSGAIDFDSVAESFSLNAPVLGFLCNSRYGWGAPAADGFGFSEYFQKEFFRQYFENPTYTLAELNAVQKLPFTPYLGGDSVYKWVAYQMNALGDATYRPMRNNPKPLELEIVNAGAEDVYYVSVTSYDNSVDNVLITGSNGYQQFTNSTGSLEVHDADLPLVAYKYGYIFAESYLNEHESGLSILATEVDCLDNPNIFVQNSNYAIDFVLHSEFAEAKTYGVEYVPDNPEFFGLTEQFVSGVIQPQETLDIDGYGFILEPVPDAPQLANGVSLGMTINVFDIYDNTILASRNILLPIKAPKPVLRSMLTESLPLTYNEELTMFVDLFNEGSQDMEVPIEIELYSELMNEPVSITINNNLESLHSLTTEIPFEILGSWNQSTEFSLSIDYQFNGQTMSSSYRSILPILSASANPPMWSCDYEDPFIYTLPYPWQRQEIENNQVLTCRPEYLGEYTYTLPQMLWNDGIVMNFDYAYRMPMYGADGISINVSSGIHSEEILFIGSGGALTRENGYIFSDWAEYNLHLSELISYTITENAPFTISLTFSAADGELQPDYENDSNVGVFVDNLHFTILPATNSEDNLMLNKVLMVDTYPNPVQDIVTFKLNRNDKSDLIVEIFNIKGQKIFKKLLDKETNKSEIRINIDDFTDNLSSGIHFYKVRSGSEIVTGKYLFMK